MNVVILVGRLTADPNVRYTQEQKAITRLTLAVNRKFKKDNEQNADFFNCIAFGKTAEFIEKYFHKGIKAIIDGELRNNHYTDQNGVKHYTEQVVINNIEFGESKKAETPADYNGFINVPEGIEEELPFN